MQSVSYIVRSSYIVMTSEDMANRRLYVHCNSNDNGRRVCE
jgi:hypothetical protein